MSQGRVELIISAKDEASRAIRAANQEVRNLNGSLKEASAPAGQLGQSISGVSMATMKLSAVIASSAALASLAAAFKQGIAAAEQFRLTTIQIATSLTNLAAEGQGTYAEMLRRNLNYAQAMYEEIRKEDAKRFASAEDLMAAYNAMVQKGYQVRLDEVDALGVLVDRIVMATAGQNRQVQINQEIRSLMEGQAHQGSMLAIELRDRLGPQWAQILEQQRESGNLLKFIASLYPGISAAGQEIEQTLEAQKTTLEGQLKYIGRTGLAGAYEDIVGLLRNINSYLREHGDNLASNIAAAWRGIREIIRGVYGLITDIYAAVRTVATWTINVVVRPLGPYANKLLEVLGGRGFPEIMWGFGGGKPTAEEQAESYRRSYESGIVEPVEGRPTPAQEKALGIVPRQTVARPRPVVPEGKGGRAGGRAGGHGGRSEPSELELALADVKALEREVAESSRDVQRLWQDNLGRYHQFVKNRLSIEKEAKDQLVRIWREVMHDEKLSYDERLSAAKQYKELMDRQVSEEIEEWGRLYGERMPQQALEMYRRSRLEAISREVAAVGSSTAIDWEAAWRRAAENVQDGLANMLYSLVTQTKSAGDVIRSILRSTLSIMTQMAAQALMQLAKYGLETIFRPSRGRGLSGLLGGVLGFAGSLFGLGGGGSVIASSGSAEIDQAIGGLSYRVPRGFAEGGVSYSPQLAWVSEGGVPEAHIPLRGGAVPVTLRNQAKSEIHIINIFDQSMVQSLALQALNSEAGRRIVLNAVTADMAARGMTMRTIRGR